MFGPFLGLGRTLTSKTQHPEIGDATSWSAISYSSSVQRRALLWTAVKGKTNIKPKQATTTELKYIFTQDLNQMT